MPSSTQIVKNFGLFAELRIHLMLVITMEPTLCLEYNKTEKTYLYEHEFDEHRNWIKRIVYENDKEHPKYIYKRSIEYYE